MRMSLNIIVWCSLKNVTVQRNVILPFGSLRWTTKLSEPPDGNGFRKNWDKGIQGLRDL